MEMNYLEIVEPVEVEQKALSIVDKAKLVKVVDQGSYISAGNMWKSLDEIIKEVKETFDPICEAANKAHKAATAKRASFLDPLEGAKKSVKSLMSAYDLEQEKIRKAEERKLEEEARKRDEEARLAEAIELEKEGRKDEAEQVLSESSVIPVFVAKTTPKIEGVVYRTIWKYRITDASKLPREFLVPDEVKIGGVVRSLKGSTNIPGVEAYETKC